MSKFNLNNKRQREDARAAIMAVDDDVHDHDDDVHDDNHDRDHDVQHDTVMKDNTTSTEEATNGDQHETVMKDITTTITTSTEEATNGGRCLLVPEMDIIAEEEATRATAAAHAHGTATKDDDDDNDNEDQQQSVVEVVEDDIRAFFTAPVVSSADIELVGPSVTKAMENVIELMETRGPELYLEYKTKKKKNQDDRSSSKKSNDCADDDGEPDAGDGAGAGEEDYDPSIFEGIDPRSYQTALLKIAREQNTIVHLGTGTGKTLIALLLIKEYSPAFEQGKQTVFLVPSVALAVQQYATIKINIPFTVGKVYGEMANSEERRNELASCNILVATHGACLDLLTHYGDLFRVSNWNLLIMDECHNCTGNSSYVTIMRNFYHKTPHHDRPRVLGLTASPLINVKKSHSDEQLGHMLTTLEGLMDAEIVSFDCLGLAEGDEHTELLLKEAEEMRVYFESSTPPPFETWPDLENKEGFPLLESRRKEFRRFVTLYEDLGPLPLALYLRRVLQHLSPNTFENETTDQFASALHYIHALVPFCLQECSCDPNYGVSHKLQVLEELLHQEIEESPVSASTMIAGVVFVQCRITVLALKMYFSLRLEAKKLGRPWPPTLPSAPPRQSHEDLYASLRALGESPHYVEEARRFQSEEGSCRSWENDQFMDAEEDQLGTAATTEPAVPDETMCDSDAGFDQFEDADPEDDPYFDFPSAWRGMASNAAEDHLLHHSSTSANDEVNGLCCVERGHACRSQGKELIRCGSLVRKPNELFKSLRYGGSNVSRGAEEDAWQKTVEQERNIRGVINGLRTGEINVLFATSVVEEGVDVQACSFVVVFDRLLTLKSYIQMKGRARKKNAKFFLLEKRVSDGMSALSLEDAKATELRVRKFILSHRKMWIVDTDIDMLHDMESDDEKELELQAVKAGVYRATNGEITIGSAKSLLYRFAQRQPMDDAVRSSKVALQAHLPSYSCDNQVLRLPAYFGSSSRTIHLPELWWNLSKKERQGILALMACVRLHKHGLLTDRLLPLSRNDIFDRIFAATVEDPPLSPIHCPDLPSISKQPCGRTPVFQYELRFEGAVLDQTRKDLNAEGRQLALITLFPIEVLPCYHHQHPELGLLSIGLGARRELTLTKEEVDAVFEFFALLMNARWKRRTKDSSFRPGASEELSAPVGFYIVGCVDRSGGMDWEFMKKLLIESKRDREERIFSVQSSSNVTVLPKPRLWSPVFMEVSVFIAYGPAGICCDSAFPTDTKHTNVTTYQDYFRNVRGVDVPADAPLYRCLRLWKLPSSYLQSTMSDSGLENKRQHHGDSSLHRDLKCVLLPKCLCAETSPVSNVALALESTILPQFLFHLERHVMGKAFTSFCSERFPVLGRCLASASPEDVVGLLSAKSCTDQCSYERLEWLGDAVLKLVQTDAIMKSTGLRDWVSNMHEGDLDSIRSVMGSNSRLYLMCKRTGFDRFIRTEKLERGRWTPASLELHSQSAGNVTNTTEPANKVCADVIEAILGFVYHAHGYETARDVADELRITLLWSDVDDTAERRGGADVDFACGLVAMSKAFTGYERYRNPRLLNEAFTHATSLSPGSSSYQRLEWIGDAVLCLAARQSIFDLYPNAEPAEMVLIEEPLISNETLSFLCMRSGLHKYLRHRDQTLPGRIESYHAAVTELGKGLWSIGEFPKPMADLVEALLGSIHCDGDFKEGQRAALRVIAPILALYKQSGSKISHPKRSLLEFGGDIFTIATMTEKKLINNGERCEVLRGSHLVPADRDGRNNLVVVRCLGFIIVAVADRSVSSATNRASALLLGVLDSNPVLVARFGAARSRMLSGIDRKTKG